jgi:hypothetical protein
VGPFAASCGGLRSVTVTSKTGTGLEHRYQGVNHSAVSYEWSFFNALGGTKTSYSGMAYGQYQVLATSVASYSNSCAG